jgi:SUKH-3 immunity protein of toxin-antitoxin system
MPERFPAEVADVLRDAGWSAQPRTDAQVDTVVGFVSRVVGHYGARIEVFPAATEVLTAFGGLYVLQDGPGRELRRRPFAIDPMQVAASAETLADLGKVLQTRLFPIGMEGDHESVLAVDEAGRVFALDHAGVWYLGASVDAAITALVLGTQPPRLDEHGNWSAPPAA